MKQPICLRVFVLLFLPFSLVHAKGQGLLEVYQKALSQDPIIAGAQYAAFAGKEKSVQGLSALLPQINASTDVSYQYIKRDSNAGTKADARSVGIELTQPVFNMAALKAYDQSKKVSSQSEIQYKQAVQDLILRVSQSYFDVLSANENWQVAISQTRAFKESLDRAILTFQVGTATKTDKLEARARFDLARATEISAKNQLAIANQSLASIIGEAPTDLMQLKPDANLVNLEANKIQHWVDTAIANNLQLQLIGLGYKISQLEVSRLKYDRLPTLNFVASAGNSKSYITFINSDITTTQAAVSLKFKLPIYTGGLMSSRIREAEHLKGQQQQVKISTQRQVILQTQQAYLNSYNGLQQVSALEQALKSSKSALEATQKGVEVGVRTNLDLLDSQQQYFSTQRDSSIAKYQYLLSLLNLKGSAGILNEKDIEGLNALLY